MSEQCPKNLPLLDTYTLKRLEVNDMLNICFNDNKFITLVVVKKGISI